MQQFLGLCSTAASVHLPTKGLIRSLHVSVILMLLHNLVIEQIEAHEQKAFVKNSTIDGIMYFSPCYFHIQGRGLQLFVCGEGQPLLCIEEESLKLSNSQIHKNLQAEH